MLAKEEELVWYGFTLDHISKSGHASLVSNSHQAGKLPECGRWKLNVCTNTSWLCTRREVVYLLAIHP